MVLKPTNADKCIKVPYIIVYLLPCFGHSHGHPRGGTLQRMDISIYYRSLWTNARCKILVDNTWFKIHIKIWNTVKNFCD